MAPQASKAGQASLQMPPGHVAYFFSDLHLSDAQPELTAAFARNLAALLQTSKANGVHIVLLGDVFEVWVGDDHHTATRSAVSLALQHAKQAGAQLYFMAGNRDFLLGPAYCQETGLVHLADPCTLTLSGPINLGTTNSSSTLLNITLSHGDALCTDDTAYQAFRQQSRNPAWQAALLAKPLDVRLQLALAIRQESTQHKQDTADYIMDTNANAVAQCFEQTSNMAALVHGHTHRSAVHYHSWNANLRLEHSHSVVFTPPQGPVLQGQLHAHAPVRIVLPDWRPATAQNGIEGGWLELQSTGQWRLGSVG